jgi:DNA polymerase-3 subunit beta
VEAPHRLAVAAMRGLLPGKMPMGFALPSASQRGCSKIEQLNIVGKRSGDGFVTHKATLVNALSRVMAERLLVMDFTIGRKGFAGYIKALSGSNIVKIVPSSNGSASGSQAIDKRLKVICGVNTSYLEDTAWVGDRTSMTFAEVKISPCSNVKPNIGSIELAEAFGRVLPFTAKEDNRPVLQCVKFVSGEGKLKLVSADGFRLAEVTLDFDEDIEGRVLIHRDDLKGIAGALRKAKRVRLGFEASGDTLEGMSLVIDTEAIRYKWRGAERQFPDYEKLIPTEFNSYAHLDSQEVIKAVGTLKAISDNPKEYPIDLAIGEGKMVMTSPDEKGEAIITADTDGQGFVRIDGKYLADVLKACGGMVDFKLTNAYSPMLFTIEGYQVVIMPMMSSKAKEQQEQDGQARATAEPEGEAEREPTEAELEAEAKPKRKRSRKREKVAVA